MTWMNAQFELISRDSLGTAPTGESNFPEISQDGRWVAFFSENALLPGDTNGVADIYLHDRTTDALTLVSVAPDGSQAGTAVSQHIALSPDGRYVVFHLNDVSDLVTGSGAGSLIYDRMDGSLSQIDDTAGPALGRFSADGILAFTKEVGRDCNSDGFPEFAHEIHAYNPATGLQETVEGHCGAPASMWAVDRSADGDSYTYRGVTHGYDHTRYTPYEYDIYYYQRSTDAHEQISVGYDGSETNGMSHEPAMSEDGRYVAFASDASNLVPGDTNGQTDVFLYDRHTASVTRINVASDGSQANGDTLNNIDISADGSTVIFTTFANNLGGGAGSYVYSTLTGTLSRVDGTWANHPSISDDGGAVAFFTRDRLVPDDTGTEEDIYVADLRFGPSTVAITGTPVEDATLTADASGLNDPDGLGTLSWQWLRDGMAIAGATGDSYTLTQDDVGAGIRVRVSYTDGSGTDETVTSAATAAVQNVNDAPVGAVTIGGTERVGQSLVANALGLSDPDGFDPSAVSYQWLRNGTDIPGATGETYTLVPADLGASISVRVSWTDDYGTAETVTSAATSAVQASAWSGGPILGTAGNDLIYGTTGDDTAFAMGGADTIYGNAGDDMLDGGPGDDQIWASSGNDVLNGGSGDDLLAGGPGDDVVWAGDGADTVYGVDGNDTVNGEGGADEIWAFLGNDLVFGGTGNDVIGAGDGQDTVSAGDGDDVVYGGAGDDVLDGGAGRNELWASSGADTITGGDGDETIGGGDGGDEIDSGAGNDLVYGGAGNDVIRSSAGLNDIWAGDDDDHVTGGSWADAIGGGSGDDTVLGNGGGDVVYGGLGDDALSGGGGDDALWGGDGVDQLIGGTGDDTVGGGAGADLFVFEDGHGQDVVMGFDPLVDTLHLDAQLLDGASTASEVVSRFGAISGSDATLTFVGGDSITLAWFNDLTALEGAITIV